MVRETVVQSQVALYQRLYKCYLIPPCLTLNNIRYVSTLKWSNPGKLVAHSPTPRCSCYWKGSLLVALDYSRQLYLYLIYVCKQDLASNNLQWLIYYKTQPSQTKLAPTHTRIYIYIYIYIYTDINISKYIQAIYSLVLRHINILGILCWRQCIFRTVLFLQRQWIESFVKKTMLQELFTEKKNNTEV